VEELLNHPCKPLYFPAYELIMDDLRDYRFYEDDMLHPSPSAINYIWEVFSENWLDKAAVKIWHEVINITKALNHRFITDSSLRKKDFAQKMLTRISEIERKEPEINFSEEKNYFQSLLRG